jgi:hypothetical protein
MTPANPKVSRFPIVNLLMIAIEHQPKVARLGSLDSEPRDAGAQVVGSGIQLVHDNT